MEQIDIMKRVAREAGVFMRSTTAPRDHTKKSNDKDFVTVADIKSQDIITKRLRERFADVPIVSEEHDEQSRKAMYEAGFTGFVLDPIDGTYNFKRDMRESAISIGYIENGEPTKGVIYDPYKDEMYVAEKGKGAYCNDQPIRVSSHSELSGASVATSNSYDDAAMARNLHRHISIYEQSGVMPWTSCPGSGVLIMAYVARGRFDAYHHNGLKPWDNAVAFLLVREAGGIVETLAGEEALFTSSTVLMGNPAIVGKLRAIFQGGDSALLG